MFRNHLSFAAVLSNLRRRLFQGTADISSALPLPLRRRRKSARYSFHGEQLEPRLVPAAVVVADMGNNDSFGHAQTLPSGNDIKIEGELDVASDPDDYYAFALHKNQTITWEFSAYVFTLQSPGPVSARLLNPSGEQVDLKFPTTSRGSYTALEDGMFRIRVTHISLPASAPTSFYEVFLSTAGEGPDIQAKTLEWDTAKKGVTISYENTVKLDKSTKGALYWATGTTADTIIDKNKPAYTFNLDKTVGTHTKFVADSQIKAAAQPAAYLLLVLDPPSGASADGVIKESDETNNVLAVKGSWATVTDVTWNTKIGGLDVKYQVLGNRLDPQTKLVVFWSQDSTRLGEIVTITDFDKTKGKHGPVNIDKTKLHDAATGTTHLLAVIDPDRLNYDALAASERAIKDVTLTPDADVNFGSVSEKSIQAIKDSLRYAGQALGNVTSAFRTTLEQAQAMINNYTFSQLRSLYGSNAAAMTGIQAAEDAAAANALARKADPKVPKITKAQLIAAMKQAFDALPDKGAISKHMGDYSQLQAIDLSHSRMTNKKLFHEAITNNTKIGKVLDPYTNPKDKAFHVEIAQ